jgi:hypothetical protein
MRGCQRAAGLVLISAVILSGCGDGADPPGEGSSVTRGAVMEDSTTTAAAPTSTMPTSTIPTSTTRVASTPAQAAPSVCARHAPAAPHWPGQTEEFVLNRIDTPLSPPVEIGQSVWSWPGLVGVGLEVRWPASLPVSDGEYEDEYENMQGHQVIQAPVARGSDHHLALVQIDAAAQPRDCQYVSVHAYGADPEAVRSGLRWFVANLEFP